MNAGSGGTGLALSPGAGDICKLLDPSGLAGRLEPEQWSFVGRPSRRRHGQVAEDAHKLRRSPGRGYQAHREWLLARHGPVCAYCGQETNHETITLDHVRPRRGQSAYDRPDNLVLACRPCNADKADKPLMAFLLGKKSRGVFLLHYGDHLSDPLKDLARNASERALIEREDRRTA